MPGRRWSNGLHQAIEAKEGLNIQPESRTLASITFQNYFRLYKTISGMSGTADTEAPELKEIYGLEVVVIPTHKPCIRQDLSDRIYMNHEAKLKAIIDEIKKVHDTGQPILVGTVSIERSEELSQRLKKEKLKHEVLNAKQHQKEALIIAQAGALGSITISTNMAGRGTDIVLGGNPDFTISTLNNPSEQTIQQIREQWQQDHDKVKELGGLYVLATERHESRRIDNQLRGRSGRQGDPGTSIFYLSLSDNLMRLFGGERVTSMMKTLGMGEEDVIEHKWLNKSIENAQKKVEGRNFDMRKTLLDYDNVSNEQRQYIYHTRNDILNSESMFDYISDMGTRCAQKTINEAIDSDLPASDWPINDLDELCMQKLGIKTNFKTVVDKQELTIELLTQHLEEQFSQQLQASADAWDTQFNPLAKTVILQIFDEHWIKHLNQIDHLRQSIGLRSYAQKNPAQEFKQESFNLFNHLIDSTIEQVVKTIVLIRPKPAQTPQQSGYNIQMTSDLS